MFLRSLILLSALNLHWLQPEWRWNGGASILAPSLDTYLSPPCIVQETRVGIAKPFSGSNLSLVQVFTRALMLPWVALSYYWAKFVATDPELLCPPLCAIAVHVCSVHAILHSFNTRQIYRSFLQVLRGRDICFLWSSHFFCLWSFTVVC